MSHVGEEAQGEERAEEGGGGGPGRSQKAAVAGRGATGPPARLGKLPRLGLRENGYGKDAVLGGSSGRRRPESKGASPDHWLMWTLRSRWHLSILHTLSEHTLGLQWGGWGGAAPTEPPACPGPPGRA